MVAIRSSQNPRVRLRWSSWKPGWMVVRPNTSCLRMSKVSTCSSGSSIPPEASTSNQASALMIRASSCRPSLVSGTAVSGLSRTVTLGLASPTAMSPEL